MKKMNKVEMLKSDILELRETVDDIQKQMKDTKMWFDKYSKELEEKEKDFRTWMDENYPPSEVSDDY